MMMNGREMSVHKLLALVALSGVLPAVIGACNKDQMGSTPPAEQSMKTSPSDKGSGATDGNNMNTQQRGTEQKDTEQQNK